MICLHLPPFALLLMAISFPVPPTEKPPSTWCCHRHACWQGWCYLGDRLHLICTKHSFAFRPKNLVFFQKFSGFITRLLANTRHDIMFDLCKSGFYVATLPKRPNLRRSEEIIDLCTVYSISGNKLCYSIRVGVGHLITCSSGMVCSFVGWP
ncbi:hypothetical protein ANANG_G00103080 [Anguilla anguilla]|uniref:Secreted protein n=1 Tax=Anguilla anguilla TaxID=7936 RepID=A0A9D3MM49_ANGAN|nr:hypothetical protein ANANG_G00103080 [Anguilla anguilla]